MNRVWINTNNRRYYRAIVQCDLLGDWTLIRSWGCLDNNRGQVRIEVVGSKEDGNRIIAATHKRRIARGYQATYMDEMTLHEY
jgi:predicted DNA-binding WGR domain protein